jgi:signal transduction histidine kinase
MTTIKRRRGTAVFRPRARVINTLGRDLITNEFVAIQELVKNAYDADATKVTIKFEEPLSPGGGAVVIADNGTGMSLATVRGAWMEPATPSKSRLKFTKKGRRVTGAKGIGRFAAARIAEELDLSSVTGRPRRRTHIHFNWGAFNDEKLYLDEVRCRWEESPAEESSRRGTELRLAGLRDDWRASSRRDPFERLRTELARLISPLAPAKDFRIELDLPERYSEQAGEISPPAVLDRPHYRLKGHVDAKGVIRAEYTGRDGKKESVTADKGGARTILLSGGRQPECGPFDFEFRVWDREPKDLQPLADDLSSTLGDLRRDLDAASGISVHRDKFRLPLPESDWLRLDLRRVQNPSLRLSNNQIVGTTLVTADDNPGLQDQTNRQGIVDSQALEDFKASIIELLTILEVRRHKVKRPKEPPEDPRGLFQRLNFGATRTYLEQRYPNDKELRGFLASRTREFEEGIEEVQRVLSRYRRLATLGQLIDVIVHEGRTPIAAVSNEVTLIRRDRKRMAEDQFLVKLEERLATVGQQAAVLSQLFDRIAPFGGRKRGRPSETTVERIIADAFGLFQGKIQELGVQVALPEGETAVTVDPVEVQSILANLIDNSLYWLEKVPKAKRKIKVECGRTPNAVQVVFSDSGPGVSEEVQEQIFDPYFSTKPQGVGLGLTIAGEAAAQYDGTLELVADGPLDGATFRLRLRKRIGSDSDA